MNKIWDELFQVVFHLFSKEQYSYCVEKKDSCSMSKCWTTEILTFESFITNLTGIKGWTRLESSIQIMGHLDMFCFVGGNPVCSQISHQLQLFKALLLLKLIRIKWTIISAKKSSLLRWTVSILTKALRTIVAVCWCVWFDGIIVPFLLKKIRPVMRFQSIVDSYRNILQEFGCYQLESMDLDEQGWDMMIP